MRQATFSFLKDYKKEFGGSLLEGKRKTMRPLSTKHPLHLVLKSCHKGHFNPGNFSLEKLIRSQCQKFGIKIFDLRPFTRILSWGRDFKRGLDYQILNQMEALGLVRREKRAQKEREKAQRKRKTQS